jgi:hypothetical protein
VVRDPHLPSDDLTVSFKRLSASSTGSTRSTHSSSSLDLVPVRDSACPASLAAPGGLPGKPLVLDLEQAMERLSRLQQAVESSVSLLMSFIVGGWRRPGNLEGNLPAVRQASDRVRNAVRDFLEFARGAVANAGQATDRSLQAKLKPGGAAGSERSRERERSREEDLLESLAELQAKLTESQERFHRAMEEMEEMRTQGGGGGEREGDMMIDRQEDQRRRMSLEHEVQQLKSHLAQSVSEQERAGQRVRQLEEVLRTNMEEQASGKWEEQERRRVHMEELYKEAREEIRMLQVNTKEECMLAR